jgi:hypothetical protein
MHVYRRFEPVQRSHTGGCWHRVGVPSSVSACCHGPLWRPPSQKINPAKSDGVCQCTTPRLMNGAISDGKGIQHPWYAWQRPTLPQCSTIGAGTFHGRVRDGIEWGRSAKITRQTKDVVGSQAKTAPRHCVVSQNDLDFLFVISLLK